MTSIKFKCILKALNVSMFLTVVFLCRPSVAVVQCHDIFGSQNTQAIGNKGKHINSEQYATYILGPENTIVPSQNFRVFEYRSSEDSSPLTKSFFGYLGPNPGLSVFSAFGSKPQLMAEATKKILRDNLLYNSYRKQGAERAENIEVYQAEDKGAAYRTTLYLWTHLKENIGLIQAQYSQNSKEPLNVISHFPEAEVFLRGNNENIPVVEIGRYLLLKRNQVIQLKNIDLLSNTSLRNQISDYMWLNLLLDLINLPPETVFTFQTNKAVFDILSQGFSPIKIKNYLVVESKSDTETAGEAGKKTIEIISKFNHAEIKELTKHFARRWLKNLIEDYLKTQNSDQNALIIIIPDKLALFLKKLGLDIADNFRITENEITFTNTQNKFVHSSDFQVQGKYILFEFNSAKLILNHLNQN